MFGFMIYVRNTMTLWQSLLFSGAGEAAHRFNGTLSPMWCVLEFDIQCLHTLEYSFSGWFEFM